jgi:hypothetical protein
MLQLRVFVVGLAVAIAAPSFAAVEACVDSLIALPSLVTNPH